MSTNAPFIAALLTEWLPAAEVVIEWDAEHGIGVTVTLSPHVESGSYHRLWKIQPAQTSRLQTMLVAMNASAVESKELRYALRITGRKPTAEAISWGEPEPPPLASVRHELEKAGHIEWAQARVLLRRAVFERKRNEWNQAITYLNRGVDILGNSYFTPIVNDDSGMKLALARSQEREGKMEMAAVVLSRVLRTRLATYLKVHVPLDAAETWDE